MTFPREFASDAAASATARFVTIICISSSIFSGTEATVGLLGILGVVARGVVDDGSGFVDFGGGVVVLDLDLDLDRGGDLGGDLGGVVFDVVVVVVTGVVVGIVVVVVVVVVFVVVVVVVVSPFCKTFLMTLTSGYLPFPQSLPLKSPKSRVQIIPPAKSSLRRYSVLAITDCSPSYPIHWLSE